MKTQEQAVTLAFLSIVTLIILTPIVLLFVFLGYGWISSIVGAIVCFVVLPCTNDKKKA